MKRRIASLLTAALLMTGGAAGAETLSLNGTVEAGAGLPVYAPVGGTAAEVTVEAGMEVHAGDSLLSLRTDKVFALQDGTVTGVFVFPGDDAEAATETYGACMYLEGTLFYTVSASTAKAYSSVETTIVHAGEKVYLMCRSNGSRTGEGMISAVDGSNYTVLVTAGNFIVGDKLNIYRDSAMSSTELIGQGTIARMNPLAVTATGAIVNVTVKDGDSVKKGDLLLETLPGSYDGYSCQGTEIQAPVSGVVASVNVAAGDAINKGEVVALIYPQGSERIEALIHADERELLSAGDRVTIELEENEGKIFEGTVRYVSNLPEPDTEEVCYKVVIDFQPDASVAYGMNVLVTAGWTEPENAVDESPEG